MASVRRRNLQGRQQFRIIPSRFPPIAIFESLVDAHELEIAYAIESSTNDRLQAEAGNLYLVDEADWVTGPGASVVMASFTHLGRQSRFSNGSYGVYYAGLDEETAIAETVFHSERRLRETNEDAIEIEMRCYKGEIRALLDDIRGKSFAHLQEPDLSTWPVCQQFGADRRGSGSFGILYRSARHGGGECVAGLRPRSVSRPRPSKHFRYCWNGERIDKVMSVAHIRLL